MELITLLFNELAQLLKSKNRITVLTGAGISTASGLPDFRSQEGIYIANNNLNVENILSETFFKSTPEQFWDYFKDIFQISSMQDLEPNLGHLFLKELEDMGKEVIIITQNVDGLHHKAGSQRVLEVHGSLGKAVCPKCKEEYGLEYLQDHIIPRCNRDGLILKPDIVLYEGKVKHMEDAYSATCNAELFLALGTSLQVYPVKELPRYIQKASNILKVIINKEKTSMDHLFNYVIHDDIAMTFQKIKEFI